MKSYIVDSQGTNYKFDSTYQFHQNKEIQMKLVCQSTDDR